MEAPRPYRPSNGCEGMYFEDKFCANCIHQCPDPEAGIDCEIFLMAFLNEIGDKDYPKEWIYGQDGQPTCTAFKKWDWDKDDDGEWLLPPENPDDGDPNQLMLFSIADDILESHVVEKQEPEKIK